MPWLIAAAVLELSGCYAVWLWARGGRSPWWMAAATIALLLFAWCLSRVPAAFAGRAFAAYAGVYLLGAVAWLVVVDRQRPDRWDLLGATCGLIGALIIVYGPRSTP
jgi:small multidrug resistance family-3 protein